MNKTASFFLDESLEFIREVYLKAALEDKILLEKAITKINCAKEVLPEIPVLDKKNPRQKHENRDDIFKVAIFLSKFGHSDLYSDTSQNQALIKISEILNIKYNYLKGARDIFDSFFDNGRKGWQRHLKDYEEQLFNKYNKISKKDFLKEVKTILNTA